MSYVHPSIKTQLNTVAFLEKNVKEQTEKLQNAYHELFIAKNILLRTVTENEKAELGLQGYDLDLLWEVCYNRLFNNGICNAVLSRTQYLLDSITKSIEQTHYGLSDNTAMAIRVLISRTADEAIRSEATLDSRDLYETVRLTLLDSVFEIWGYDWSELADNRNK